MKTFDELAALYPAMRPYVQNIPPRLKTSFTLQAYEPGAIIHYKDTPIERVGIVVEGEHNVINLFENGNIFLIEKNKAISFIGEVTILADYPRTSVTIQAASRCVVLYWSVPNFISWIESDNHFLRLISRDVARKLYRTSYRSGERLFYSSTYIVGHYILSGYRETPKTGEDVSVSTTRDYMCQELGMNIKTLNRAIAKLKDQGFITLVKGKIHIISENVQPLEAYLEELCNTTKNGCVR